MPCALLTSSTLQVRNEMAEDFLSLLKEWEALCKYFSLVKSKEPQQKYIDLFNNDEEEEDEEEENDEKGEDDGEVFEVERVLAICYGDPNGIKKRGLFLKVFECLNPSSYLAKINQIDVYMTLN